MKRLLITMTAIFCMITAFADGSTTYREGDIIFQMSKSKQSPFIAYATGSPWTHCGIVVYRNNEPYVLEASNVVKLTPLNEFYHRGRFSIVVHLRYTDKPIKINYKKYLGLPYDSKFSLTNNRYYCSELVWHIYKTQLGVELCRPKPLGSYRTRGLGRIIKKRGINPKSKFIAPSDLMSSTKLYGV